jgi:hypothetical protein
MNNECKWEMESLLRAIMQKEQEVVDMRVVTDAE